VFLPTVNVVDFVQTCNDELVFSLNRCCCAEWVDDGLSVHVKFNIPYESDEGDRKALIANEVFIHYFAESELVKAESLGQGQSKIGDENSAPFDGLSCKAFKLDKLKMGEQAQRIVAFEESREKS